MNSFWDGGQNISRNINQTMIKNCNPPIKEHISIVFVPLMNVNTQWCCIVGEVLNKPHVTMKCCLHQDVSLIVIILNMASCNHHVKTGDLWEASLCPVFGELNIRLLGRFF